MPAATRNRRVCPKGHVYFKSSSCPTCPKCESERKPKEGFLSAVAAPARRALEAAGLTTLKKLSGERVEEILELHGMGPGSIPKLRAALKAGGLDFRP